MRYKPNALTRLMHNLIHNSLRHDGGGVLVEVGSDRDYLWISIRSRLNHIAEESPLIQAMRWASVSQQSGLGSAIICRISDVHHSILKVSAESHEVF